MDGNKINEQILNEYYRLLENLTSLMEEFTREISYFHVLIP